MAPDPKLVPVANVTVVVWKQSAMRARKRHALLVMARLGADPSLG